MKRRGTWGEGWHRACATVVVLAGVLVGCDDSSTRAPAAADGLAELMDELWAHEIERDVLARSQRGLPVTELPDLSFAAAETEASFQQTMLGRLLEIERSALDLADQLTLDALLWETSMAVEGLEYFWLQNFLTPYASPLRTLAQLYASQPLATQAEADAYLALVNQLPGFIAALEERTRGQADRGIAISRANLSNVVATWRSQVVPAELSMAWPSDDRLAALPEATVMVFRAQLAESLEDRANPAFVALADYLEGPYAALSPQGVGLGQYPGGREYYRYLTRLNTTMRVSPEEVQEAGRELLAEFRRAMADIRREVGFEGTREEFHEMLRSDARFFPATPDEVEDRLMAAADSMWARIQDYFQVTQQAGYGARRLRSDLEPTMTYGYYNPPSQADPVGYYNFNGSSLDERSWIGLTAIGLHELIPGHHFQIARQLENESLHDLRRSRRHTAFTEGWGSYASFLGLEAGVYQDPYSRYGLYALESFLATRLVVDPGMNYFDMTLEEARQFMRENTLESERQIETESLRYATDIPGQALGYQMGKRMFVELRNRAEERLGPDFDLPALHEVLLEHGSLPMVVVQRRVEMYLDATSGEDEGS